MRATVEAVFVPYGIPTAHPKQSADVLLYADVRGYDTRGMSNMLRVHVDFSDKDNITPTPKWNVMGNTKPPLRSIRTRHTAA